MYTVHTVHTVQQQKIISVQNLKETVRGSQTKPGFVIRE